MNQLKKCVGHGHQWRAEAGSQTKGMGIGEEIRVFNFHFECHFLSKIALLTDK